MLGHKNVSITLSTYTKFIKEDDVVRIRNIEKMGTIMGTFSEEEVLKPKIRGL